MKIFETHAHLDFQHFDKDREQLLKKCFNSGIEYILNIGVDEKTCNASINLAEKYDRIYASVGFHPHDATDFNAEFILQKAKHPKVIAIGEIGLDYYRNLSPKDVQKKVFEQQIKIALELDMPIIVHDRDAHEDCYDILCRNNVKNVVFHCFSGDEVFAQKLIGKGWYISFTGTVTYKNSNMENIIRLVPEDKFFIETDSPYLSPHPQRGKRNSPLNLQYIIEKISEIRGVTPKKIAELSYGNGCDFFNLTK
ncbi:MAG: TatD family hydrolase [Candidatus Cloacimonetes bacterium]|nr:TatD family hydrolase [Candidatus Cloacimonadota bacterium]